MFIYMNVSANMPGGSSRKAGIVHAFEKTILSVFSIRQASFEAIGGFVDSVKEEAVCVDLCCLTKRRES